MIGVQVPTLRKSINIRSWKLFSSPMIIIEEHRGDNVGRSRPVRFRPTSTSHIYLARVNYKLNKPQEHCPGVAAIKVERHLNCDHRRREEAARRMKASNAEIESRTK